MTKAYAKWDGTKGVTSLVSVAMVKTLIFGTLIYITLLVFYTPEEMPKLINWWLYPMGAFYLGALYLANKRHSNNYEKYKDHWKGESRPKRILKGISIVVVLVIPWVMFFGVMMVDKSISPLIYIGDLLN